MFPSCPLITTIMCVTQMQMFCSIFNYYFTFYKTLTIIKRLYGFVSFLFIDLRNVCSLYATSSRMVAFFMNSKSDEKNSFDVLIIFFFRTDKTNVTIAQILTNSIFTKKRKINILDSDIIFINKSTIYLFINKRNTDAKIKMLFTFGFFFIC